MATTIKLLDDIAAQLSDLKPERRRDTYVFPALGIRMWLASECTDKPVVIVATTNYGRHERDRRFTILDPARIALGIRRVVAERAQQRLAREAYWAATKARTEREAAAAEPIAALVETVGQQLVRDWEVEEVVTGGNGDCQPLYAYRYTLNLRNLSPLQMRAVLAFLTETEDIEVRKKKG